MRGVARFPYVVGAVGALAVGSCASSAPASSAATNPAASQPPPPSVAASAGPSASSQAESTSVFQPAFTYRLPATWYLFQDEVGFVGFLPVGKTSDDFNAAQSDGINVVNAAGANGADCSDDFAPGIARDPASIAAALANRPGLKTTTSPISVGGLSGIQLDIQIAAGWSKTCPGQSTGVVVPLIHGTNGYDQMIGPRTAIRLDLLGLPSSAGNSSDALGIEMDDQTGGSHLASLSAITNTFAFAK